jgi:hypothetical protein
LLPGQSLTIKVFFRVLNTTDIKYTLGVWFR